MKNNTVTINKVMKNFPTGKTIVNPRAKKVSATKISPTGTKKTMVGVKNVGTVKKVLKVMGKGASPKMAMSKTSKKSKKMC